MKRLICLLLTIAMLCITFCGCRDDSDITFDSGEVVYTSEYMNANSGTQTASGSKESGDNQGSSKNSNTNSTSNNGTGISTPITDTSKKESDGFYLNDLGNTGKKATVKNNCYSSGYPIAQKQVTFNVMIKDYTNGANYNKMAINDFLEKKMNIKINWTVVSANDVINKQILAYSSGNLPDIFIGMAPHTISGQWKYIKQGLVLPLDSYIKNYAPNYTRLMKQNPEVSYYTEAQDGKTYSMAMVNDARKEFVYEGLYINKNWMKNLNLSMPKTTSAFMKVLNSFKNNDPNGNGKADEIPLLLRATSMAGVLPACLYGPFGISTYGGNVGLSVNDSGKVVANCISKNYKTALTYYKTLYKNGLIDKDWLENTDKAFKDKLNTKTTTVGAFVAEKPLDVVDSKRFKEYTLVPAFQDKSVKKATWSVSSTEYVWAEWFLVTKACKYPEIAVRFADYFYSLEGTLAALQGPQGKNWDIKSDGKLYMTDSYYSGKNSTVSLTPGYPLPHWESERYNALIDVTKGKNVSSEKLAAANAAKDINKTYLVSKPKNLQINFVDYDKDKNSKKEISDQLVPYIQRLAIEFVTGSTDIGAFWDNYVGVCKNLGCENQVYYAQIAYDRYKKKAAK